MNIVREIFEGMFFFIVDIFTVLWVGIVLSVLWGWFIAAKFNLPHLSVLEASGVALVVALTTHRHIPKNDEEQIEALVMNFFAPLSFLLLGIFLHWLSA